MFLRVVAFVLSSLPSEEPVRQTARYGSFSSNSSSRASFSGEVVQEDLAVTIEDRQKAEENAAFRDLKALKAKNKARAALYITPEYRVTAAE